MWRLFLQTGEHKVEGDTVIKIFNDDDNQLEFSPQNIRNTKSCRQVVRIQILIKEKFNIHRNNPNFNVAIQ